LHNAIRFNRPGGRATLRGNFVGREGEPWFPGDDASRKTHLKVTVEDTGKGFESSLIEELYKPFSQVHLGGGKKMQGTVLSLSLIKKCVELHEGRFWAESKPGVGSRFSFTIPLDLQKQALIEWGKKKVLVVDDDPDYMRVVLAYFKEEPYEVLTARDGLDALRIVEEESPDLILMDVLMPKMDGIEVCKALKHEERFQRYRHIPVIIFTSLADLASKVKGIQAGADDFLVKPLDKDLLKERVKSLIEAKEQFEKMLASYRDLEKDSTHDPLTGLYNRRYMDEALVREFKNAARFNRHISLLMVDIDHFKNYNDTHGHQEGDHLLQGLAQVLKETVRDVDVVARFGGEEFVVILPETPSDMAMVAAERIRVGANSKTGITISIGVATYPEDSLEKDGLMEKADQALYEAKGSGRDRSVKYHAEESAPKAAASERDKDLPS
jgi:diguanylate cyclase (GGDEF)-like protein